MTHVDAALSRIVAWLAAHAPGTAAHVRGPATEADIMALQRDVRRPLPADLLRWWATMDGFTPGVLDPLIPGLFVPLPVAQANEDRRSLLESTADEVAATGEAGDPSHTFVDGFVPIADDHCGDRLFVDLREGPLHGCVGQWDHEDGALRPIVWDGVVSMLEDIADGLELGTPVLESYADRLRAAHHFSDVLLVASVDGEALRWVPARDANGR